MYNYQAWNAALQRMLFPSFGELTNDSQLHARFDIELRAGNVVFVAGRNINEQLTQGVPKFTWMRDLYVAVESRCLVNCRDNENDLTKEFIRFESLAPNNSWSKQKSVCPYIALLSYLTLVAKSDDVAGAGAGFYDRLHDLRKKFGGLRRDKLTKTASLAQLPLIFERLAEWLSRERPHLAFERDTRYYPTFTLVGRLLDEAILSTSDIDTLRRAAFKADLGPESADLKDLFTRLAVRIDHAERLRGILTNHTEGMIAACVRDAIRTWDGSSLGLEAEGDEQIAEEAGGGIFQRTGSSIQSRLIWDPSDPTSRPKVHLLFRGKGGGLGTWHSDGALPQCVDCDDGDFVWARDLDASLDIAFKMSRGGILKFGAERSVCFDGFKVSQVETRVYYRRDQPNEWWESRGRLPRCDGGASEIYLLVATINTELNRALETFIPQGVSTRVLDGVTLSYVPASEAVGILANHGFQAQLKKSLWIVGGLRLGRGSTFDRLLPPEVHVGDSELNVVVPEGWEPFEAGAYILPPGKRPAGTTHYQFACDFDGRRETLNLILAGDDYPQSEPIARPIDSFCRSNSSCQGFLMSSIPPGTANFEQTPSNALCIGEIEESMVQAFKRDVQLGRMNEGGALLMSILRRKGQVDDMLFGRLCNLIWQEHHAEATSTPHDAEVRRQREALIALGHAEYFATSPGQSRSLRAVDLHAVLLPRLRSYGNAPQLGGPPRSAVCVFAGWILADFEKVADELKSDRWDNKIRLVMHRQSPGLWAVPPRLALVGPASGDAVLLLEFLQHLAIPVTDPRALVAIGDLNDDCAPDLETWHPVEPNVDLVDFELYTPSNARWMKIEEVNGQPRPWDGADGLWGVRRRDNGVAGEYWTYYVVRKREGLFQRSMAAKDPHASAAWYGWLHWQKARGDQSVIYTQQANPQLWCLPFNARPPWWLERMVCGHSGFASEWVNFGSGAGPSRNSHEATAQGYPFPDSKFLPSEMSPRASASRLHAWRDLSEKEVKMLLWSYGNYQNRPDLIQR